jgi:hypothetical protein
MGVFGELFGAGKLRKVSQEDEGTGERFDAGPLDLDSGVVPVRPAKPADRAARDQDEAE